MVYEAHPLFVHSSYRIILKLPLLKAASAADSYAAGAAVNLRTYTEAAAAAAASSKAFDVADDVPCT